MHWNATSIVKDILTFPTDDIQKNNTWFQKKNSEYESQINFKKIQIHQI